jgi:two-component system NtrC family response regulator
MQKPQLLLVDDDKNLLRVLTYQIRQLGFEVVPATSAIEALALLEKQSFGLVLTDLRMPEMDGLELIRRIRESDSRIPVIVLTAHGSIDKAVEAIKIGASDFLTKPAEKAEVEHSIGAALRMADLLEENRRLAQAVERKFDFKGIVGTSKRFTEVLEMASQLAEVNTTVLIQGESGTGKELIARAIHFNSQRRNRPFVVINCGAIPADLMESELFGYRKGAFTGAVSNRQGKFDAADSGTVFLDEVGELPLGTQVKLLRVLQEREVDVLGDAHPHRIDVRILAATNQDLQAMMEAGKFREDLYYRLSVAPLFVPSLRERREDIPLLIHHILAKLKRRIGKEVVLDEEAIEVLQGAQWPGNVRELENLVERLVVFSKTDKIEVRHLPPQFHQPLRIQQKVEMNLPAEGFSLDQLERDIIQDALVQNDWNQSQTARYLGITRNTLIYRMQKFNLRKSDD